MTDQVNAGSDSEDARTLLHGFIFQANKLVSVIGSGEMFADARLGVFDWAVLYVLKENGAQRLGQLARATGGNLETARAVTQNLRKRGLVFFENTVTDGKHGKHLSLTAEGDAALARLTAEIEEHFSSVIASPNATRLGRFSRMLRNMAKSYSKKPPQAAA